MRVTFPLLEKAADADLEPSPPGVLEEALGTGTILVVDHSAAIRSVLQRMLARGGFEVLTAPDGVSALEMLERHRGEVAVVLTDVNMPRMSGPALMKRIRADFSDLGVILMSGRRDEEIAMELEGTGTAFLQKPFASEELVRLVKRMLSG